MSKIRGSSWLVAGAAVAGALLGVLSTAFRERAALDRASVAEGRALEAIDRAAAHGHRADTLESRVVALEASLKASQGETAKWREEAAKWKVPTSPIPPPPDAATAVASLRSVGLSSASPQPFGVGLNLPDTGTVLTWNRDLGILTNKQIAQEGQIKGLESQVGILGQQKVGLQGANAELRAKAGDLKVAADQFKVAYEQTDRALTLERRMGKLKVAGAFVLGGGLVWIVTK